MLHSTVLAGILALLADPVFANGRDMPKGYFITPKPRGPDKEYGEDPVYVAGENVEFKWSTLFRKVDIVMYQQHPDFNAATRTNLLLDSSDNSIEWKASRDWTTNTRDGQHVVAYLALHEAGTESWTAISHYFNITDGNDSSSSGPASTTVSKADLSTATVETGVSQATSIKPAEVTAVELSNEPTTILMTATDAAVTSIPSEDAPSSAVTLSLGTSVASVSAVVLAWLGLGIL